MRVLLVLICILSIIGKRPRPRPRRRRRRVFTVAVIAAATAASSTTSIFSVAAPVFEKREIDYIIAEETYWKDESAAGEMEKLVHDYPQNQELIRNIGATYYQIIYPEQIRRHEKTAGISTRETAPTRLGKHYHRTSLLIKAFSHRFRLDLELNTQLLAPNLMQKHYLPLGAEQVSKQEIEHCYYHGTVKDIPGATAAFHTCHGISGVIHIGNETFVIHPFYGGDLSKQPHVIYETQAKSNNGCANKGNSGWGFKNRKPKRTSLNAFLDDYDFGYDYARRKQQQQQRAKRDVRDTAKFIETALIVDRSMFDRRNGSTRAIVIQDALQIANIVDLYFRTINTRVSIVYIETWQGSNQISIEKNSEIDRALLNFSEYVLRQLFNVDKDTVQLLTGERFAENDAGMAVAESICTQKSLAINVDLNVYEPHITAATMAHMIGHNVGMGHDDAGSECFCRDWHGCIMKQKIVGQDNIHPYKFSECSLDDYIAGFREHRSLCLFNKPNEVLNTHQRCGNRIVEENEDCDCGSMESCEKIDPCCDPITCKLKKESQCSASQKCCTETCQFATQDAVCRPATNECDLPDHCSGKNAECPIDQYKKNGRKCGGGANQAVCFNGICPTLNNQCELIWGKDSKMADDECYEQLNVKGSKDGHCGVDQNGNLIKCQPKNVFCGLLQCANGSQYPQTHLNRESSRTEIRSRGVQYECKSTRNKSEPATSIGLVEDGTPCGKDQICVDQTCSSVFSHLDRKKCPSNHKSVDCSSHGECSNLNVCYCDAGWTGPDCSIQMETTSSTSSSSVATPSSMVDASTTSSSPALAKPANTTQNPNDTKNSLNILMGPKETQYENAHSTNTVNLVGVLMLAVGGVFTVFTTIALCYRRSTMPKIKYDSPHDSKKKKKTLGGAGGSISSTAAIDGVGGGADGTGDDEIVVELPNDKIIAAYPGTPSCGQRPGSSTSSDSRRVFYRPSSQQGSASVPPGMAAVLNQEYNIQYIGGKSDSRNCLDDEQLAHHHLHHHHQHASQQQHRDHHHHHHHHHHPYDDDDDDDDDDDEEEEEVDDDDEDDESGPIRIRNLEDLIRQLEHHSKNQSGTGGSGGVVGNAANASIVGIGIATDEKRGGGFSESEADRQYRLAEIATGNEELRFVFGRFRQPSRTHTPPSSSSSYLLAGDEKRAPPLPPYPSNASVAVEHHPTINGQLHASANLYEHSNGFVDHHLHHHHRGHHDHRPLGRSASEDLVPIVQPGTSPLASAVGGGTTAHRMANSRHGSPAPHILFYSEPIERTAAANFVVSDTDFRRISSTSLHRNQSIDECSSRDTIESSGNENSALLRPSSVKYPEYKH